MEPKTKALLFLCLLIFSWYFVANVYRMMKGSLMGPVIDQVYTAIFTLPVFAVIYLIYQDIDFGFKKDWITYYSIAMLIVFSFFAFVEIPNQTVENAFLTGFFDHTFFPIAFGLLFSLDRERFPKNFWAILLVFGIFILVPTVNIATNLIFDADLVPAAPGLTDFFGKDSISEIGGMLPHRFFSSLGYFLRELFTFNTFIPLVIIYYFYRNYRKTGNKRDCGINKE